MIPMFAIQVIQESVTNKLPLFASSFLSQPIDVIFYDLVLWFGWIPVLGTLLWGFSELWLWERQGQFAAKQKYIMLAVDVPAMTEQTPKALENMFNTLYAAKSGATFKEKWFDGKFQICFSFEIVSEGGYIQFLIRTQEKFRDVVEAGIYAQYPDAEITQVEDYAAKIPAEFPSEKFDMWGAEFTLDKDSHFPIRTYVDFEDQMTAEIKDPLGYTLEQMAKMKPGEHFWIQIIIQPGASDWRKAGVAHVNKLFGIEEKAPPKGALESAIGSFAQIPFELIAHATSVDLAPLFGLGPEPKKTDDPWKAFKLGPVQQEEAKAILRKTTKIGHGVKLRIVYVAEKPVFKKGDRVTMIKGILNQYTHLNLNSFKMHAPSVPKDDYFWQAWSYQEKQVTLMKAYQSRSFGIGANPVFLNAEELATLWHFPTISIKAPLIKKAEARRAEPPVGLPVTFLEDVLPTGPAQSVPSGLPTAPDIDFPMHMESAESRAQAQQAVSLKEPLPETLPRVVAPTEVHADKDVQTKFMHTPSVPQASDDDFAPPDLPV